ncbi:hypothetical protein GGF50DRAFT_87384 [Schizophyllum commune]
MEYSSGQNQDYVFWHGVDPSWLTSDHAVSAFEEEFHPKQEPQFTPNHHLVQPFDPPMDPFPADQFSMLTPVPTDVGIHAGFPLATPPEGLAVDYTEPENNAQHDRWNVEGELLDSDIKYEHGLGLYFEEPLIESLDVDMLGFEPAPAATAALPNGSAQTTEQAGISSGDDEGTVLDDLRCARDVVSMQEEVAEQASFGNDQAPAMQDVPCARPSVSTLLRQQANAMRRKTNTIIQCSLCTTTFTRKHNLNEHMKLHANKQEFRCKVASCKKRFNTAGGLRSHRRHWHGHPPSKTKIQTSTQAGPHSITLIRDD